MHYSDLNSLGGGFYTPFRDVPVAPTSDRKLIFREAFCFCIVSIWFGKASVQINKVGVPGVSEKSVVREMAVPDSGTAFTCLFVGLSSG